MTARPNVGRPSPASRPADSEEQRRPEPLPGGGGVDADVGDERSGGERLAGYGLVDHDDAHHPVSVIGDVQRRLGDPGPDLIAPDVAEDRLGRRDGVGIGGLVIGVFRWIGTHDQLAVLRQPSRVASARSRSLPAPAGSELRR